MSIQNVKFQRIQKLKEKLNSNEKFQFSENMKAIFQSKQDLSKFEYPYEQKSGMRLEPIIIGSTTIKPIMTKEPQEPQAMDIDIGIIKESSQTSMQDISPLLTLLASISVSNARNEILQSLICLPIKELTIVCQTTDVSDWSEEIISELCNEIEKNASLSIDCVSLLVRFVIYPKICIVKNINSRILISNINLLSKQYGKAVAEGLVIPILFEAKTERTHVDMLEKLITKIFGPVERLYLLDCMLKQNQEWNDYIIQVVGFVLDTEPFIELDGIRVRGIIPFVQQVVQDNPKDRGSIRLFITLSKKYSAVLLSDHLIDAIEQVAKQSKHMMSKSLLNQLNQLKKKS